AVRAASKEVTIGAVISPNSTDGENGFYIYNSGMITSLQGFSNLFPEKPYSSVEIKVNGEINDELNNRIMSDLETIKSKYNGFLYSYYEATVWEQKSDQSFFAALLAIILIGFMVCTGIINSTISAQIRENKRVIGTLRAVGANESDFIKSYLLQLLSMFKWGAGIGFGGFAAAYCTIWIITKYFSFGTFEFEFCPWPSAALAVIIFAVCAVNIRLKVRREMKNSIVENIREL
ncbi:MAG: hypothetical protein Q4P84_09270, partial [Elusimicrobiales bacterium]|nr:hypothetical protein [Elusimicrobiales bacterium]